ncbi:MAG: DUF305 domain-containing protein [Candidatus Cellulosilyticum pullistercoris]|uniref:DUF305 domain-containing protein n=1 Tax=Candidatus Cellulosilyticum pullistercoris TaxID=2838521 RepID=A0A9E2NME6_9FIRM|nr:DUF305 domain-containing protein [Candidatus Cellulosilyticum pullistercoris]
MNKQVYYWCTVIVIAVVVVIGFLTVSDNGNTSNNQSIYNETEQNVGTENKDENTNITVEENNLTNYLEDQTTIMDKMLTEMKNIPHVGNPAIDFLYGMTLHHESAIAMAESYLKYGGNHAELKQMAEDMIKTQDAEIEQMQSMIQKLEEEGMKDETKEAEYLKAYQKILEENKASHSMGAPDTIDEAFAEGMTLHHEMAVQMAETVLQYTENEEVRHMAQNIIEMQNKEITKMRELINQMANQMA